MELINKENREIIFKIQDFRLYSCSRTKVSGQIVFSLGEDPSKFESGDYFLSTPDNHLGSLIENLTLIPSEGGTFFNWEGNVLINYLNVST